MPYDIQSNQPDILKIGFNMNDCNYWKTDCGVPRVSSKAFEANLHEIIERAFTFKSREILLLTNHPSCRTELMKHTNITYQQSTQQYNKIIRNVAASYHYVKLIDIEKGFEKYFMLNDENIIIA